MMRTTLPSGLERTGHPCTHWGQLGRGRSMFRSPLPKMVRRATGSPSSISHQQNRRCYEPKPRLTSIGPRGARPTACLSRSGTDVHTSSFPVCCPFSLDGHRAHQFNAVGYPPATPRHPRMSSSPPIPSTSVQVLMVERYRVVLWPSVQAPTMTSSPRIYSVIFASAT